MMASVALLTLGPRLRRGGLPRVSDESNTGFIKLLVFRLRHLLPIEATSRANVSDGTLSPSDVHCIDQPLLHFTSEQQTTEPNLKVP